MSRAAIGTAVFFVAPGTMAGLVPWLITDWADPRGGVLGVLGVALVLGGIYRFVRNPMYVGVAAMIFGQALLFRSPGTALWAVVFLATTATFVVLYEQPQLQHQFGESYERYRKAVPGWWPRLTPYRD